MPSRPVPTRATTAVARPALDDSLRADLLRTQQDAVQTPQQLPQAKVIGQAALFEFDDSGDQMQTLDGVILHTKPRNILWRPSPPNPDITIVDRVGTDDVSTRPLCTSDDGKFGTPQPGFHHVMLDGAAASGDERIDCSTCKYNQWASRHLLTGVSDKRKAATNQRVIYLMVAGRQAPVEVVLSPTSISALDKYVTRLTNQGTPVQTIATRLSLAPKVNGSQRYAVMEFEALESLDAETFSAAMRMRDAFMSIFHPSATTTSETHEPTEEENLPF